MREGAKEGGEREIRGEDRRRSQTERLGWEAGENKAAAGSERAGRGSRGGGRAVDVMEVRLRKYERVKERKNEGVDPPLIFGVCWDGRVPLGVVSSIGGQEEVEPYALVGRRSSMAALMRVGKTSPKLAD
ncbi:hypothetical protein Trydic_g20863 [Trypoxylus dichotomus]